MPAWFAENYGYGLTPLLATFCFVFGAVIGSFLNALLWRLRTGESVAKGRSYCPCCHHTLASRDLVPIFSYLFLGGKCRYCRKGIHPSYVMVELAVGALFTLFALKAFAAPQLTDAVLAGLLRDWYAAAVLTVVFVFDLRYMIIPRSVTLPATIILAAASLLLGAGAVHVALGLLVGAGFFQIQHLVSRGRWIGGGDIHLGALMGVLLGWPLILVALFLAYVTGAVVGVAMLAGKRVAWKGQLPFGTFLSAATVVTMLWGARILEWYLHITF
jgi:prepilin signal peptidase PulO-like enzyme (type II secretory pathway)